MNLRMKYIFTIGLLLITFMISKAFAEDDLGPLPKRKIVPALPPHPDLDTPFQEKNYSRVDPHGALEIHPNKEQVQKQNECLVCHLVKGSEIGLKPKVEESCFNCHNHSPHSGIAEHLKAKITCTACHSFHRGDAVEWIKPSGRFSALFEKIGESDLSLMTKTHPMLRKRCTDCHKW